MNNLKLPYPISLDELPYYSEWPRRLLGLDAWKAVRRDREKVAAEYDQDKYARCLEFFNTAKTRPRIEDIRDAEFRDDKQPTCASRGDTLFMTSFTDAYNEYYALIADSVLQVWVRMDSC